MSNRRFETNQYRQALVQMRQGDSGREIARSSPMGHKKLKAVRKLADASSVPGSDEKTKTA